MATLAQVIAIRTGIKQAALRSLTDIYQQLKADPLGGLVRTYAPRDEEGEQLPKEEKVLQTTVVSELERATAQLMRFWDVTATVDLANTEARADVVVGGQTLLVAVPVTSLLFLEKQTQDLKTALSTLPTLDPGERWHWDDMTNCYVSEPARTTRTKKVLRNHVKAEATPQHPAQVEIYTEDQIIGDWTRTLFSGAMPVRMRAEVVERTTALLEALKMARENANRHVAIDQHVGKTIMDWVLQPL